MRVPGFVEKPVKEGRGLVALSEFDVDRDLFKCLLVSSGGFDEVNNYYLTLETWTERELSIFINFTKPEQIGADVTEDKIVCSAVNP